MDKHKPTLTIVPSKPALSVVTPMPLFVMAREIASRYGGVGAIILVRIDHEDGTSSTRMGTHNLTRVVERDMLCDAMVIAEAPSQDGGGSVIVHHKWLASGEIDESFSDPDNIA
jgi:hypothetical protein